MFTSNWLSVEGRESTTVSQQIQNRNSLRQLPARACPLACGSRRVRRSVMLPGMHAAPSIAIVGPGNLGCALALSLARAGFNVEFIVAHGSGKSLQRARALARQVQARPVLSSDDVTADLVWFCVPDSQIAPAARLFARTG